MGERSHECKNSMAEHVRTYTPNWNGKAYPRPQYANSHSMRCLQQAQLEATKAVSEQKVVERIERMQAWETRRLLHREELRVQQETRELQEAPFMPKVSSGTIRILKQQESRSNRLQQNVANACFPVSTAKVPISRTQTTASCPNSRATSPELSQLSISKLNSLLKRPPKAPKCKQLRAKSGSNTSAKEGIEQVLGKALSPVHRMVSYSAGCDFEALAKRAAGK